ncbi:hypothetical protein M0655_23470 (plasmid) [Gordonia amicalis]|uniref:hypothetical protein n=1 Tax=Gordonia TaxID=2053 RepID=UPI001FB5C582|nr:MULTISPECIES: hypothetical protein [Gordonia]MDH3026220.1 hypothetical protein [Gordonia alkanivorans]UOG23662.1 hypothetical protein MTX80_22840 [Gordonia amicalis]UPW16383.1 hypothetical protein M0655_23470 [Gordonia amicalis]
MSAVDVLRDQLREQSPALSDSEIQDRLDKLRTQLADMIESQAQLLIEQWRDANPGQDPEFEDQRRLQNQARMIANEVLSAQLQESMTDPDPQDEIPAEIGTVTPSPGSAVHQWLHENLWAEASRDSDQLAEKLWADKPPAWVVRAASLIEARSIDGLVLPAQPGDQAAREVEAAVEADLAKSLS